ncbi:MAG: hypothetical protein PHW17_03730 [Desulfobacterales bacterium]|nr:hypothetical protein [Desulfobacterales bacterium]
MSACNGTMMQYFHRYPPADGALWKQVPSAAPGLAELGITALRLPPLVKGNGTRAWPGLNNSSERRNICAIKPPFFIDIK